MHSAPVRAPVKMTKLPPKLKRGTRGMRPLTTGLGSPSPHTFWTTPSMATASLFSLALSLFSLFDWMLLPALGLEE